MSQNFDETVLSSARKEKSEYERREILNEKVDYWSSSPRVVNSSDVSKR